jgi:hypothetical protein
LSWFLPVSSTFHPADLPTATTSGSFFFTTPKDLDYEVWHAHPRLSDDCTYGGVEGIHEFPRWIRTEKEKNLSSSSPLHLGVWEITSSTPYITSNSKNQHPTTIAAMDGFLLLVKELVAPKIYRLLQLHSPKMLLRQTLWF